MFTIFPGQERKELTFPSEMAVGMGWRGDKNGGIITKVIDIDASSKTPYGDFKNCFVPLLLSHGDKDDIADTQFARDAKKYCTSAKLSIYKRAGHAPHAFDTKRFNKELIALTK